jgi:signal transduction histidine kinase
MNPQIELDRGRIVSMAPKQLRDWVPELLDATQRIAELEALSRELERTNRTYVEMLGFVAHELKNALASAVLSLHTVKDGYLGDVTPAQMRSLESAARSLEDLHEMIRNYLDFSHLEGEIQVTRTYFPLNARVVQPLLEEMEGQVQRRQMFVENGIPEGKVVCADADLLKIIYRNLLSNAVKYGREGGAIRLEVQEDGQAVTLSVRNDGNGIAPDQMPLLFKRFSRLYHPEHPTQRGTGLGLYICRQIVEKHGGEIWADSKIGEWTRFSFTLRQAKAG